MVHLNLQTSKPKYFQTLMAHSTQSNMYWTQLLELFKSLELWLHMYHSECSCQLYINKGMQAFHAGNDFPIQDSSLHLYLEHIPR